MNRPPGTSGGWSTFIAAPGSRRAGTSCNATSATAPGRASLAGPSVRGGLAAPYPQLTDLDDGDLKTSVDFRRVYATVLTGWLGLPAVTSLGGDFECLPLLNG
jgi:uncharacterized protein (DUF1501 family)